ncbi:DNA phosphorothioation-associated methyltransferase, partial [Microcoleus sp. herbarium14]
ANQPKISYLFYPDFDTNPHPVLHTSMHINLRGLSVGYQDYSHLHNPPILVRKEAFVSVSYPHYQKFAKLSRQEEKLGIFDKWGGFKERELLNCLEENCVRIKGHRLFWRSDIDPEKLKMLQKAASERQQKKIEVNAGKSEGTAEGAEEGKEEGEE